MQNSKLTTQYITWLSGSERAGGGGGLCYTKQARTRTYDNIYALSIRMKGGIIYLLRVFTTRWK